MRRLRVLLILLVACSLTPWPGVGSRAAAAQELPQADVRLVSQSPWTGTRRPLRLSVSVTNRSDVALENLSVVLTIHFPARSRSVYELSLTSDATSPIFAYPFEQQGALLPGQSQTFAITQSLEVLAARGESALYPLKVQVLSSEQPVGVLRTPMIFLAEPVDPEIRLNLAWTWVLSAPLQYGPGAVFEAGGMEADIAPGGRLDRVARMLEEVGDAPVDVVVSAALVDQLARMADGYFRSGTGTSRTQVRRGTGGAADAARLLDSLRSIAARRTTEIVATPFGDASLPALLEAEMEAEAADLLDRGRELVASVIDASPREDLYRPPYSRIDGRTMAFLDGVGVRALLIDAGLIRPERGLMFTPSPIARLHTSVASMLAVRPDRGTRETIDAIHASDPRLAAQTALGQLAATWLEFPGTPGRGVALLFGEDAAYDQAFLARLSRLVTRSPWLRPVPASWFASFVGEPVDRQLPQQDIPTYAPSYLAGVRRAREALEQFASATRGTELLVDELQSDLTRALAGTFLEAPARGQEFLSVVERTIGDTYRRVEIVPGLVTLASQAGSLPVTIRNGSGYPIQAQIQLVADRRVSFLDGGRRAVVLPPETVTLTFGVRTHATGRFPVRVELRTGMDSRGGTIAETNIVVRSTAYNRIALVLTIGAGLFLLGWWGRRLVRRRKV